MGLFLPLCPSFYVLFGLHRLVMHLNDIPMDCRRANLRLGNHVENNQSGMYAFTSPVAKEVLKIICFSFLFRVTKRTRYSVWLLLAMPKQFLNSFAKASP